MRRDCESVAQSRALVEDEHRWWRMSSTLTSPRPHADRVAQRRAADRMKPQGPIDSSLVDRCIFLEDVQTGCRDPDHMTRASDPVMLEYPGRRGESL